MISGSMFNSASWNGIVEAFAAANAFPIRLGAWHTRPIYLAALRFVYDHLWRSFAHFNLGAHLLDLGGLFFELRNHGIHFPLQLSDRRLLFLYLSMLFEEVAAQLCVHRFVAEELPFET